MDETIKSPRMFIAFLSETVATALLMFIGCMGCIKGELYSPTVFTSSLGFGMTVMMIINIFGMVSGAHLNPAVTIAAVVYGIVTIPVAIVYILGQLVGAFIGYFSLRILMGEYGELKSGNDFCATLPSVPEHVAFFIEFSITMVLILVCCGVWDYRNSTNTDSVSIRFGLTVTCLSLVAGPFSSASMNPARSFAPALYNWNWKSHWIYWVAPLSSALFTSISFKMIFSKELPLSHEEVTHEFLRKDP